VQALRAGTQPVAVMVTGVALHPVLLSLCCPPTRPPGEGLTLPLAAPPLPPPPAAPLHPQATLPLLHKPTHPRPSPLQAVSPGG
jgi:hypothetical protein